MSMQNENKDSEARNHQSARDRTADSASGVDTSDTGAKERPALNQGNQQSGQQSSQQSTLPPGETDEDQYDQGTVQQAP